MEIICAGLLIKSGGCSAKAAVGPVAELRRQSARHLTLSQKRQLPPIRRTHAADRW